MWSSSGRHRVLWWKPIDGMLGSVIKDPLFINGEWAFDQIWLCCGVEKAMSVRVSLIVAWRLPTLCGVPTYSTCIPSLFDAGEVWLFHQKRRSIWQAYHRFGYYPPLRLPRGLHHHPGPVASHCGIHLDFWKKCFHSQHYPKRLDIFSNFSYWQTHLKYTKLTASNEPLWHHHVSSLLLELWLMCMCSAPALAISNVRT